MPHPFNYLAVQLPDSLRKQMVTIQQMILQIDSGFKPHKFNRIHMTLLFMEYRFKQEKAEDLDAFDMKMKELLESKENGYQLKFSSTKISLFGHGNLVVMEFIPNADAKLLFDAVLGHLDDGKNGRDFWNPHITLGKLRDKDTDLSGIEENLGELVMNEFESNHIYTAGLSDSNKDKMKWDL